MPQLSEEIQPVWGFSMTRNLVASDLKVIGLSESLLLFYTGFLGISEGKFRYHEYR